MWWVLRHPALALLAATGLLSPAVFPPATVNGQENDSNQTSSAQTLLLNDRIVITLTHTFALPSRQTPFDRAVRDIGDQIDRRREVELDKATTLGAIWRASFWKYLPKSSGGTLNSPVAGDVEDPFIVPFYLLPENMILDRQVAESDRRARLFFSR